MSQDFLGIDYNPNPGTPCFESCLFWVIPILVFLVLALCAK